jgi:hypothetical protein
LDESFSFVTRDVAFCQLDSQPPEPNHIKTKKKDKPYSRERERERERENLLAFSTTDNLIYRAVLQIRAMSAELKAKMKKM